MTGLNTAKCAALGGVGIFLCFVSPIFAACGDFVEESLEQPICKGGFGTFLPAFNDYGEANWPSGLKIFLYLLGLLWTFSGIGVVTDVFMEAIEVITSKEKQINLKDGRTVAVQVTRNFFDSSFICCHIYCFYYYNVY